MQISIFVALVIMLGSMQCVSAVNIPTHTYHPVHFATHNKLPLSGNILPVGIYYTYVTIGDPYSTISARI